MRRPGRFRTTYTGPSNGDRLPSRSREQTRTERPDPHGIPSLRSLSRSRRNRLHDSDPLPPSARPRDASPDQLLSHRKRKLQPLQTAREISREGRNSALNHRLADVPAPKRYTATDRLEAGGRSASRHVRLGRPGGDFARDPETRGRRTQQDYTLEWKRGADEFAAKRRTRGAAERLEREDSPPLRRTRPAGRLIEQLRDPYYQSRSIY